jgi:hypothetical protein
MAAAKSPTPSAAATPASTTASAPAKAVQPAISAAHTPTPAQQNPQVKRPLAPYLPEKAEGTPDPVRSMEDRQRAAIAARVKDPTRQAVDAAGVDGAAPLPKSKTAPSTPERSLTPSVGATSKSASPPTSSAPAEQPSSEATSTPSASPATDPDGQPAQAPAAKGPRYDVKSFKKWAEENPEAAAEIRTVVFKADADSTQEWIRVQNKIRKVKQEHRAAAEKTTAEAVAERAQAAADRKAAEDAAGALRPVIDLWEGATRKDAQGNIIPDFDVVDAAFESVAKMPLDAYMRLRARRGVANPEGARLRAENARLQRELEAAKGGNTGAASPVAQQSASPPSASAVAQPDDAARVTTPARDPEREWGDALPKAHKLRQLASWAAKLDAEMDKYHDAELDEYSRDPEDVADSLLKRELAAFIEEEAPEPKKRAPAGKPSTPKKRAGAAAPEIPDAKALTPKAHKAVHENTDDEAPTGFAERERWALRRAAERLTAMRRGEAVE